MEGPFKLQKVAGVPYLRGERMPVESFNEVSVFQRSFGRKREDDWRWVSREIRRQ